MVQDMLPRADVKGSLGVYFCGPTALVHTLRVVVCCCSYIVALYTRWPTESRDSFRQQQQWVVLQHAEPNQQVVSSVSIVAQRAHSQWFLLNEQAAYTL